MPENWKVAIVIPIFKKGEKSDPGNYCPISLTSVVCKVLASIIRDEVIKHMSANNLFTNHQHGFFLKRSCMSQLLTAMELLWTDGIQKGNLVDVIYVDFKKAFDKMPHERLLLKLKAYVIAGKLIC